MTCSTHEAARAAGVSFRQATYWCAKGIFGERLRGLGSGGRRRWTAEDVTALRALAAHARFLHHVTSSGSTGGNAAVLGVGPDIVDAVRARPDADWLVIDPDRNATAHVTLVDAVKAVALRGGILLDLASERVAA